MSQPIHNIKAATDVTLHRLKKKSPFDTTEPIFEHIYHQLERINRQTERLRKIIENFRQFARGNRNHREFINLNQLLEQTIETIFAAQFRNHQIKLVQQLESEPLMVYANPFLLQEILSILLTNATEAIETQKHPTVWVTTFRSLNSAGFKVEDNGSGLAPEYRQHLFEPFMSTGKGTGLGLHLAYQMVQELKGRLNYQERSGGGASFIVSLPTEERLWNHNINY